MPALSQNRRRFLKTAGVAAAGLLSSRFGESSPAADETPLPKPGRLLDCHLHINHFDRSVEDTLRHMDETGTTKAFILPLETGEGGVVLRSETVLHAFHQYNERLIPFCQTDIRQPDVLERIKAYHLLGCRGIGEQKEHLPLNDKRVEAVIALCDELNWPITIHFQDSDSGYNQGLAAHLETYLKRYKKVRIIGHAQTFWANISADVPDPNKTLYPTGPVKPGGLLDRLLSDYPNLYADMSAGSGYGALTRDEDFTAGFFERHPRQILFGSDCPCRDGKGENFKGLCYSTQLQRLLRKLIPDEARLDDAFFGNAMRALNGTTNA
ncbi:MAG: amidohydrolase family protein [Planctomycetaceae bacterium]